MKYKYSIILLFTTLCTFAQEGQSVYEFLNIESDPRSTALGGNIVSIRDYDINTSSMNPSSMSEYMSDGVSLNYVSYLTDINYGSFNYGSVLNEDQFIRADIKYINYGSFKSTDELGNVNGTFKARDLALSVGYAQRVSLYWTLGVSLKYINSSIEQYNSSGLAVDTGVTYHDEDKKFSMALVSRNMGTQISNYDHLKEKLPFQINFGMSQELDHLPLELTMSLHDLQKFDISNPFNETGKETTFLRKAIDHVSLGAEFFPRKAFNLRFGYNFKRGNDLQIQEAKSFSGLSMGFGVRFGNLRFDYSHARYHSSGNVNNFGFQMNIEEVFNRRRF